MKNGEQRVFFIADTHFGHRNIIKYAQRPFRDTAHMEEQLISRWNSTVRASDEVFLLGDFSFENKERSMEIGRRLNGRKTLILGNHDSRSAESYLACGFRTVSRWPIIYENFWILSHEPMPLPEGVPFVNLFGHIHTEEYDDPSRRSFCVSAERIDYRPIELREIMKALGITRQPLEEGTDRADRQTENAENSTENTEKNTENSRGKKC